MDLECSDGGTAQYGCNIMGISAGCGDIYGANLSCQWIDLTTVPDGDYTMVVRTNWDQDPDAIGNVELTYERSFYSLIGYKFIYLLSFMIVFIIISLSLWKNHLKAH